MTLKEQIGQMVMAGLPGTELTREVRELTAEYKIGNFILFRHNIRNNVQVRRLCEELQECALENTGHGALIAVDQEGGSVTRLGEDAVNIPGAMAIAATGDKSLAHLAGNLTGRQLRSLGINFDFAPVLDINCNPDNPVIGVRSYGDTPEQVSEYGLEMIRGLQDSGVMACAKHFPGHGDTNQDSHLSLPCVDKPEDILERSELFPFKRAVEAGTAGIMTAHILFPALEPAPLPATMSHRIITGLLRNRLGFDGLVVTDSMEMAAIREHYGTVRGAEAAVLAGADIVLVPHTLKLAAEVAERLEEDVLTGKIPADLVRAGSERVLAAKSRYCAGEPVSLSDGGAGGRVRYMGGSGTCGRREDSFYNRSDIAKADKLLTRALTAVRLPDGRVPDIGANPLFVSCPCYRSTQAAEAAGNSFSFAARMVELSRRGDALLFSRDPDEGELTALWAAAEGHSSFVAGTYNGHLTGGQKKLIRGLERLKIPTVLIALGNPYDLLEAPGNATAFAVWEYSERSVQAVWSMLNGRSMPEGRMPVRLEQETIGAHRNGD